MTDRKLTAEEKSLWNFYTKDIKPSAVGLEWKALQKGTPDYTIKVPPKNSATAVQRKTLSNHESLQNKDSNWGKKLKQGKATIDGKIDLHGLTCIEAHEKLHDYLERARQSSKRVVLVVTGKGHPKTNYQDFSFADFENRRGALRREVPMWLSGSSMRHMIVSFQEARERDGGAGALYVVLKRKQ